MNIEYDFFSRYVAENFGPLVLAGAFSVTSNVFGEGTIPIISGALQDDSGNVRLACSARGIDFDYFPCLDFFGRVVLSKSKDLVYSDIKKIAEKSTKNLDSFLSRRLLISNKDIPLGNFKKIQVLPFELSFSKKGNSFNPRNIFLRSVYSLGADAIGNFREENTQEGLKFQGELYRRKSVYDSLSNRQN
jgi:hypothetical protein